MAALRVDDNTEALAERNAERDRLGVAAITNVRTDPSLDTDADTSSLSSRDCGKNE